MAEEAKSPEKYGDQIRRELLKKSATANFGNYLVVKVFQASGFLSVMFLLLIMLFLAGNSLPAIWEVGVTEFISGIRWRPSAPQPGFGAVPLILSSVLVTVGALLIAIPWALGGAVFLGEVAPRPLKEILKPIIEILQIFPSVVLGFLALIVLSPIVARVFGLSSGLIGLTGAIILAVMTLPTIISISEDALNSVPQEYREASIALGATRWETTKNICLPAASSGIMAAVMLGFGRAVGETMAVMMATGNALDMPLTEILGLPVPTLLESMRTMTATIAIEGSDVPWGSTHYHALFVIGLLLFIITFLVNLAADILLRRFQEVNRND